MNNQRKILYIEDDPSSRALVERTLQFAGYHVLVAERGLEGIDLARREQPDLILTDINLPDLSGREITTRLRADARFKNTPIVALTAQGYGEFREMALAVGISGYMTKPVDVEVLPREIEAYLSGKQEHLDKERTAEIQVVVMQDMVRQLEDNMRKLEENNRELQRMDKVKEAFIQKTAHELRTPLAVVFGYSRMLEEITNRESFQDENLKMMMKMLIDAIQRLHGTINEVITASRIMTRQIDLSIGTANLQNIVHRASNFYEGALAERHLTLHTPNTGWPASMRADAELLYTAIQHLLSNAIKYTPDTGHIYINVSTDTGSGKVRLSVRDTGIGLSKADLETVFEKFHSGGAHETHSSSKTAYKGGGLGLGLTIVRGIVEAHGGRIWVDSPGYDEQQCPGSEFFIELPLVSVPITRKRVYVPPGNNA
ncbi:MAG: hybrid sensor histidine kinase/response regulator [Chloroflexi bacterium]|nr:hybrid sensor histidine kinase/response regulator [Chloroflexota bacterium]